MIEEHEGIERVTSSRGAQWAGAGSLIALAAGQLLGGGLGGILGGGGSLAVNAVNAAKDAHIAKLESEKYTDEKVLQSRDKLFDLNEKLIGKIVDLDKQVASLQTALPLREQLLNQKIECCCQQTNTALQALSQTVASITKLVVPNTSVCPGWGNVTITPVAATTAASA